MSGTEPICDTLDTTGGSCQVQENIRVAATTATLQKELKGTNVEDLQDPTTRGGILESVVATHHDKSKPPDHVTNSDPVLLRNQGMSVMAPTQQTVAIAAQPHQSALSNIIAINARQVSEQEIIRKLQGEYTAAPKVILTVDGLEIAKRDANGSVIARGKMKKLYGIVTRVEYKLETCVEIDYKEGKLKASASCTDIETILSGKDLLGGQREDTSTLSVDFADLIRPLWIRLGLGWDLVSYLVSFILWVFTYQLKTTAVGPFIILFASFVPSVFLLWRTRSIVKQFPVLLNALNDAADTFGKTLHHAKYEVAREPRLHSVLRKENTVQAVVLEVVEIITTELGEGFGETFYEMLTLVDVTFSLNYDWFVKAYGYLKFSMLVRGICLVISIGVAVGKLK